MTTDKPDGLDVYLCIHCGALVANFYLERHLKIGHNYSYGSDVEWEKNFKFAFRMKDRRFSKWQLS